MRYWWVNQNQTYRHEVGGGYLWSPKRKANQAQNPFYDFMREVAPGDVVFSFADTVIRAIGIAASHAYEAPKPLEFGQAGAYWDNDRLAPGRPLHRTEAADQALGAHVDACATLADKVFTASP